MISNQLENIRRADNLRCKAEDLDIAREMLVRAGQLPEGELRSEYETVASDIIGMAKSHDRMGPMTEESRKFWAVITKL